jgi:hypothetical protein
MADDTGRAYFKSQGWPYTMTGGLKTIAQLDKGELIAIACRYAAVLRTEFGQITTRPQPPTGAAQMPVRSSDDIAVNLGGAEYSMNGGKTWTPGRHPLMRGEAERVAKLMEKPIAPGEFMHSHSPAALAGVYVGRNTPPKGFVDLKNAKFTKYPVPKHLLPGAKVTYVVGSKQSTDGGETWQARKKSKARAKRGHGPRKKNSK